MCASLDYTEKELFQLRIFMIARILAKLLGTNNERQLRQLRPIVEKINALTGKSVHLVTVNDYLAKRDSEWMAPIYQSLGLSVACLQNSMNDQERKNAYNADILYATNNELGFDYLRDNMKFRLEDLVQR